MNKGIFRLVSLGCGIFVIICIMLFPEEFLAGIKWSMFGIGATILSIAFIGSIAGFILGLDPDKPLGGYGGI